MSETRGVFVLLDVVQNKLGNTWVELSDVWVSPSPFLSDPPNTGYFGGGQNPSAGPTGNYSTMDKVTYASDTTAAVPGAALSAARYGTAASSARANALPEIAVISSSVVPVIV